MAPFSTIKVWYLSISKKTNHTTYSKQSNHKPCLLSLHRVSSSQGKVREIPYQAKVRELSGNFVMGQGKLKMLGKVREKSGNFERVMAMVVSWVIWNILDNILIHCWWSCWHQWQIQCLVQHWQLYDMQQGLNSQGTHHISPLWVNYEVLFMRILKKTVMLWWVSAVWCPI